MDALIKLPNVLSSNGNWGLQVKMFSMFAYFILCPQLSLNFHETSQSLRRVFLYIIIPFISSLGEAFCCCSVVLCCDFQCWHVCVCVYRFRIFYGLRRVQFFNQYRILFCRVRMIIFKFLTLEAEVYFLFSFQIMDIVDCTNIISYYMCHIFLSFIYFCYSQFRVCIQLPNISH